MALNRFALTVIALLMSASPIMLAQDVLSQARALYDAADFDAALKLLDETGADTGTPDRRQTVREYRALCLLALDRAQEMEQTIEQMIAADPFYRPGAGTTPRRFVAAFDRVHRQLLPSIVRERYSRAQTDWDQKRFADALDGFELVLRLVEEAGAESTESEGNRDPNAQWLADFAELAARHLEESRVAQDGSTHLRGEVVYQSSDEGVTAPVPIRQDIPSWPPIELPAGRFAGELELVVNTTGAVETATIVVPVHPAYDEAVLQASRKWKYRPAMKDGLPVNYRKLILISLAPQGRVDPVRGK